MKKLNLNFSHSFEGKVWNMTLHPDRDMLLLEERSDQEFKVKFHLLDLHEGNFIQRDIVLEEPWWITASFMQRDLIFFYVYPEQENPDKKNIYAYDINSCKVAWSLKDHSLLSINDEEAIAWDVKDECLVSVDLATGKTISSQEGENEVAQVENKFVRRPFHYSEGTEYFETVNKYLAGKVQLHAVGGIDYYENEDFMVISFYYKNSQNKLANDLLVLDRNGDILFTEKLGNDLSGISDETFFIYHNKLIFVKESRTFLMYQLV